MKVIDPEADVIPLTISRRLKGNIRLFKENNIIIDLDRDRKNRTITITRQGDDQREEEEI